MKAAKALVAFAVPASLVFANVGAQFLGFADDDLIVAEEWKLLALGLVSAIAVYFKRNAPTTS